MDESGVLRLFRFRPTESGSVFDSMLRAEILPALELLPGLIHGYIGRRGPDHAGERVIASTWESREAMAEALGEEPNIPQFLPQFAADITDGHLEILPIAVALRFPGTDEPRVLRVFRGDAGDELDDYIEEVRAGTLADAATPLGPSELVLGVERPSRFVTVSAWQQWAAIEASTGSDIRHPVATRHVEFLRERDVDHYEILAPITPSPSVRRLQAAT